MVPYITWKNIDRKVKSIWFDTDEDSISHVSFEVKGELITIFGSDYPLDDMIKWEER